jgi:hypothetical protein
MILFASNSHEIRAFSTCSSGGGGGGAAARRRRAGSV